MHRTIRLNESRSVKIVSADDSSTVISGNDAEMDKRAKEAVRSAVKRARVCNKPVARYDRESKRAYIETADGEKIYVG